MLIFLFLWFSMTQNIEHEISSAHKKLKYQQIKMFMAVGLSDVVIIMLINVKMQTINIYEQDKFHAQLI